jgi:hypothetical protein
MVYSENLVILLILGNLTCMTYLFSVQRKRRRKNQERSKLSKIKLIMW